MSARERRPDPHEPPPMLVLGTDQPDVEDTTPEQLRRQQEEAQQEIERRQREAQEQIKREREEAERELKRQQADVDRAQRDLYRKERRLRKQFSNRGLVPADVPLVKVKEAKGADRTPSRPFFRAGSVRALSGLAILSVLVFGVLAGHVRTDPQAVSTFVAADEARMQWQRVSLQLDEDLSRHLAGQEVELVDGQPATLALVDAAAEAYEPEYDFYVENFREDVPTILREGVNPVSALTTWSELRRNSEYVVSRHDVEELREATLAPSRLAPWSGAVALITLLTLVFLAWRSRAWRSLVLLVLATGFAVAVLSQVGRSSAPLDKAEAHAAAVDSIHRIMQATDRDLETAYGLSRIGTLGEDPEYWSSPSYYLDEVADSPQRRAYEQARPELGAAVNTPQVYAAGIPLIEAGRGLVEERGKALEAARETYVASLSEPGGAGAGTILGGISGGLIALALALGHLRRGDEKKGATG